MNKALTTMMTAAFMTTCLTASAYNQPTPDEPLVIWENADGHDLAGWNKLGIKQGGNLLNFLSETPSSKYNYYIQCLTKDENGNYITPKQLQIGTNYGTWSGDTYTETGESAWFDTLLAWSYENYGTWYDVNYQDVLFTNQLAYNLRRSRNLQINGEYGKIYKVQIIAVQSYKEKTVFRFTGSENGKNNIHVDKGTNSEYGFWNSDDNNYIMSVSGDFIKGLNLEPGDRLGFNFNYGQSDSYANVYYGIKAEGEAFTTIQVPSSGMTGFFDITEKNIAKIEESGLSVKGKYINIDKILTATTGNDDPEENGDDVTAEDNDKDLIDIFIPGVYPDNFNWNKDFFGRYYDGELQEDLMHFGIGVINENEPSRPYGQQTHMVYSFFDEWWDDEDYNTEKKNSRELILDRIYNNNQKDSWPLQLEGTMIPNMSRIQLGDKIIINLTARGTDGTKNSAQAQLGTFDPEKFNPEDPNEGHYSITAFTDENGNPQDWRDFESGTHTVEFIVNPTLLEYITRYGLTINGRYYDINWVKAEVAKKNEDPIDKEKPNTKEYYYNVTKKIGGTFASNGLLELTFPDDNKYNETITHYYDDENKTQWINSVTETHDDKKLEDGNTDQFLITVNYLNGERWERIHVESTLPAECFKNDNEPMSGPAKVNGSGKAAEDNNITYIDGITGYAVIRNHITTNQNRKTMVLYVEPGDIRNSIVTNGIQVRGKKYNLDVQDKDVFTSVDDITSENDVPTHIYTLSGIRVSEMTPGNVYIVKKGNTAKKVKF